ncbi:unnamed protein product [Pleuronectes platessa]|uniref:CKK domain-containing protein n=1 Tax=Pleuronectes platessa TaxID=8262 RepID=A0A9N7V868_PLEPL|nr:unnamed protein product [Pleuronectes platessa]
MSHKWKLSLCLASTATNEALSAVALESGLQDLVTKIELQNDTGTTVKMLNTLVPNCSRRPAPSQTRRSSTTPSLTAGTAGSNSNCWNQILEELEKCESNHLMILFPDAGCQFRALYKYHPDTEEIQKVTGTGPESISKNMIDKLYKYSSNRKQFTVLSAKTVPVSVDALTIHNHLWQVKRSV